MTAKEVLEKKIETISNEMETMDVATVDYEAAAKTLALLMDRLIEIDKNESEAKMKISEAEETRFDHIVGHAINVLGIVTTTTLAVWGTKATFRFEEFGTATTVMGRGWFNKLLPKK